MESNWKCDAEHDQQSENADYVVRPSVLLSRYVDNEGVRLWNIFVNNNSKILRKCVAREAQKQQQQQRKREWVPLQYSFNLNIAIFNFLLLSLSVPIDIPPTVCTNKEPTTNYNVLSWIEERGSATSIAVAANEYGMEIEH